MMLILAIHEHKYSNGGILAMAFKNRDHGIYVFLTVPFNQYLIEIPYQLGELLILFGGGGLHIILLLIHYSCSAIINPTIKHSFCFHSVTFCCNPEQFICK